MAYNSGTGMGNTTGTVSGKVQSKAEADQKKKASYYYAI